MQSNAPLGATLSAGLGLLVALLLLPGLAPAQSEGASPKTQLVGVVNINTATPEELELLPGVGPTRARSIVEYRKAHGPFENVAELEEVSGIGPRALERMHKHCAVSGKTTAELRR